MNVKITILQDVASVPEAAVQAAGPGFESAGIDGEILTLEQPFMELMARKQVAVGAAVRVDADDAIWLGEIERCAPSGDDFSLRVHLKHVLRDFETLARLAERFGSAPAGKTSKSTTVQV